MKNYIKACICVLTCMLIQENNAIGKIRPSQDIRSKNNVRRNKSLSRYFNLNADAQDSTVVQQVPYDMQPTYDINIANDEMPEEMDNSAAFNANENESYNADDALLLNNVNNPNPTQSPDIQIAREPKTHRAENRSTEVHTSMTTTNEIGEMQEKKEKTVNLVDRAVAHMQAHDVDDSLNIFSHTKDFVIGDLYIFVYNRNGVCLAQPQSPELLWQNVYNMQDVYGRYPVQSMIKQAEQGGGWINYEWEGATQLAYVKEVIKNDETYIIGAGFFTHSKRDAVVNLVKSAVAFFNNIVKQGLQPSVAFSVFNYPTGDFVQGDLHLYAVSFEDGNLVSNSEESGFVGTTNAFEYRDAHGKYVNKDIAGKLEKSKNGIWEEYIYNHTIKRVYAEKVQDAQGKSYFIACGYYPEANKEQAVSLVRKAYKYMKANGATIALREFTGSTRNISNEFKYANLSIVVYSLDGKCMAHGSNASLVGKNRFDLKDSDGRYYVREMITKAQEGGGWINYKTGKLFRSAYVELIDMGIEQYVISTYLYPISKQETTMLMVKGAVSHIESAGLAESLGEFVKRSSKFRRGDLYIFVVEDNGICLAYGDEYDLIWRNLVKEGARDEEGKPFIKNMIDMAKHGPSIAKYKLNKAEKLFYIEPVRKNNKNYIVGSGYYL